MQRISHIDGLRGVSVVYVVLFHAFPSLFPYGFIGVDFFFVISGFVICLRYVGKVLDGSYSLRDFWIRRVNRLLPALLVCMLLCVPAAILLMQPDHLENFFQSGFASSFGLNNVLLYLTGGYWQTHNELKPLFTTWSLGIEEQFYVLFAVCIFFLIRFRKSFLNFKSVFTFVASIGLVSFCAMIILGRFDQQANFLLLPSRIWEFCFGIVAAIFYIKGFRLNNQFATNLSLLIIFGFSTFGFGLKLLPVPNFLFLIPLTAISLLCCSDAKSLSLKILNNNSLHYLGLASYSIYLYHQPVLAFARLRSEYPLTSLSLLACILLSFGLGILSYEIIEKKSQTLLFARIFKYSYIQWTFLSFLFGLASLGGVLTKGMFELRFPYLLVDGKPPEGFLGGKGYVDKPRDNFLEKPFPQNNNLNIAVIGNSKARDFINTLIELKKYGCQSNISYIEDYDHSNKIHLDILRSADHIVSQRPKSDLNLSFNQNQTYHYIATRPDMFTNITPIMFISDKLKRTGSRYYPGEGRLSLEYPLFEPTDDGYRLNDIKAFDLADGARRYTNANGSLVSFDNVHLTQAGTSLLAKELQANKLFRSLFCK